MSQASHAWLELRSGGRGLDELPRPPCRVSPARSPAQPDHPGLMGAEHKFPGSASGLLPHPLGEPRAQALSTAGSFPRSAHPWQCLPPTLRTVQASPQAPALPAASLCTAPPASALRTYYSPWCWRAEGRERETPFSARHAGPRVPGRGRGPSQSERGGGGAARQLGSLRAGGGQARACSPAPGQEKKGSGGGAGAPGVAWLRPPQRRGGAPGRRGPLGAGGRAPPRPRSTPLPLPPPAPAHGRPPQGPGPRARRPGPAGLLGEAAWRQPPPVFPEPALRPVAGPAVSSSRPGRRARACARGGGGGRARGRGARARGEAGNGAGGAGAGAGGRAAGTRRGPGGGAPRTPGVGFPRRRCRMCLLEERSWGPSGVRGWGRDFRRLLSGVRAPLALPPSASAADGFSPGTQRAARRRGH